jgi:diguanylate cyclase (GGDEF)-like protein
MTGKAAARMEPRLGSFDPNDIVLAHCHFEPTSCHFDPTSCHFEPTSCHFERSEKSAFAEAASMERGPAAGLDFKSCAVAPILSYGELLGTINVYDVCSRAFGHDEVRILAFVAHEAGLALQNARAFEDARDCALRDPLTNLRNGRFLRHCLERELSRCGRLGEPLSVLGIDLDSFKAVNDLLGHEAGDRVLRDVADVFRRELRDYDVIVRNGGDEFVVVLPGTDSDEAWQTAERIQTAVAAYAGMHVDGVPGFGASVGAASYPDEAADATSLLARADAAMYRDKRSRKQRRLAA